jgi:hypothetical protein|tara:strand:- start:351 stop:995 length:645 start_codon:yes stop_codon:yes gene_type:complete
MQIKINKEGKKKNYNLIKSWNDVTLDKWVKLITKKNKLKAKEAQNTISVLSDIPKKLINELAIGDVAILLKRISDLQAKENTKLNKIITINDIKYGFHPNLEELTLGEYADIETYLNNGMEDNIDKIMAVLYRPITEEVEGKYSIEAYGKSDLRMRAEKFKKMKAKDISNCLLFFWTFVKELSNILPLYLMERNQMMIDKLSQSNLQTSGVGLV